VAVLVVVAVITCSDDGTHRGVADGPAPTVRLDSISTIVLGADDSAPLFQVSGGVLLDDGLVVGEQSTGQLRFYRSSGRFIRAVGGAGEGPGEFRRLGWLQRVGDRIFAYDLALQRLSEYRLDGTYVHDVRIEAHPPFAFPYAFGLFANRSILVAAYAPQEDVPQQGAYRPRVVLMRYAPDGTFLDSLGWYAGTDTYVEPWGRGGQTTAPLVFGRQTMVAVSGNLYFLTENDGPAITVFDTAGSEVGRLHPPGTLERRPVRERDIAVARGRFARFSTPQVKLGEVFDRMPLPDTFPIYGWAGFHRLKLMRAVTAGEIWVLNFGGARDLRPRWSVYDTTGAYKGDVIAPEEMELLDATHTTAAVLQWDEMDVETVRLRPIRWASQ
jgi:hypothetical protein